MPVDLKIGAEAQRGMTDGKQLPSPAAPGAVRSPQMPGQVPDRSTVPGQQQVPVPPATAAARPLSEEGTAQAIMNVYAAKPGEESDPARFEQATASYEELRKAYPAMLPSDRPGPGSALAAGNAVASEAQEIGGLPAVVSSQ